MNLRRVLYISSQLSEKNLKYYLVQKNSLYCKEFEKINFKSDLYEKSKTKMFNAWKIIFIKKKKKSGVALTQLSLTLHNSRRIFYCQYCIHFILYAL